MGAKCGVLIMCVTTCCCSFVMKSTDDDDDDDDDETLFRLFRFSFFHFSHDFLG